MMKILFILPVILLFFANKGECQSDIKTDTANKSESTYLEASFPGGDTAWKKFLMKNLNSSIPAKYSAPTGFYDVIIEFRVNVDSSISFIKPLTDFGYSMELEALRVIKKTKFWIPAF